MNSNAASLYRFWKPRLECARDSVVDVDPMRIDVRIDERSEAEREHWRDRLKRKRREPHPAEPESPATPVRRPPDALIDDYAAPR
jgi:hypothetical protein